MEYLTKLFNVFKKWVLLMRLIESNQKINEI